MSTELLLAYYGDDFTGSTDVLEVLSLAGARTVLFIHPPSPAQLEKYGSMQAIGVAGMTRSMVPDDMEKELRPAFELLKASGAKHVHYKVCSTFDSSPEIGSIGKAIDLGGEIFQRQFIPLVIAAPALGRYCVFGNLFARMGIGSMGNIYRLDRHPSVSRHPVTPADESDLRLYLSKQTLKSIALIDVLRLSMPVEEVNNALQSLLNDGAEVILFDGIGPDHLSVTGEIIDRHAGDQPFFSAGSSGIESALTGFWVRSGILKEAAGWAVPGEAGPILVVSGSCSPVTAGQIAYALGAGFKEVALDTVALATTEDNSLLIKSYILKTIDYIENGDSVIVHTSSGDSDPRPGRSTELLTKTGFSEAMIMARIAKLYGDILGEMVKEVARQTQLKRIVVAGGDTSSYAARAMGIEAVEMIAPLSPGAPLCKAHASGSPVDGLEVNFKGGQVGDENYFCMIRAGDFKFNSPQRT
jgi:3-oxoisoapionate kinase